MIGKAANIGILNWHVKLKPRKQRVMVSIPTMMWGFLELYIFIMSTNRGQVGDMGEERTPYECT